VHEMARGQVGLAGPILMPTKPLRPFHNKSPAASYKQDSDTSTAMAFLGNMSSCSNPSPTLPRRVKAATLAACHHVHLRREVLNKTGANATKYSLAAAFFVTFIPGKGDRI
jgi:hypothetical protein